jgi:multidrug efflux pump subunit AcrB
MVRAALKNPHAVVVIALIVTILGAVSVSKTPVDVFPDLHIPAVLVAIGYRGMPAEDMESTITRELERQFMQADGIEHMESRSLVGIGLIKIYFQPDADVNAAISQVISLAIADLRYLPPGTLPPLVVRFDATSIPVCQLTLSSDSLSASELYDVANYTIRQQLGNVPGVSAPPVFGGRVRQVMVYMDPNKLQAQKLSPWDVVNAVYNSNLVIPTGEAKIGNTDYAIESNSQLTSPKLFNDIPVSVRNGATIFVKDVASAEDSTQIVTNVVRVDGHDSVYLPILKQGGANTIKVVEGVREAMKNFVNIPKACKLNVVFDQSIYVREAIANLEHEGMLGAVLAGLMVLIFLASFRSTIAILISIPLSVVTAFAGLYFTGETVNLMTLGGLALAVGRVVDDAIVVLENVARHLEMGKSPTKAAYDGASEVAMPVFISTVTTMIVFLPVVFLTGIGKYLFTPLGKSVAFAMGASYFFAMTFVPAFCARFLTREAAMAGEHSWFARKFERFAHRYEVALRALVKGRRVAFACVAAAFVFTLVVIAPRIGQEFFPAVDAGQFVLNVRTLSGMRVEESEQYVAEIEELIRQIVPKDELDTIVSNVGIFRGFAAMYSPNSGEHTAYVQVKLTLEHKTKTAEIVARVRKELAQKFPDVECFFQTGGIVSAALDFGLPAPIDVQVMDEDLIEGRAFAEKLKAEIEKVPGTSDTLIEQSPDMPSLKIDVDRVKAANLGLSQRDVVNNLVTAFNSSVYLQPMIWIEPKSGNDYFVAGQYREADVQSIETLQNVPITGNGPMKGLSVPARNLARITRGESLVEANHYNIQRTIDVFTTPFQRDIGSVARDIEKRIEPLVKAKPENARVRVLGEVASMRDSFASFGGAISLAVLLVYLVLVAQFRSTIAPLLIIMAVPLGFIGVLTTLWLTSTTINVQTFLGVMMLVGIVVSNSILLVEFADRRMEDGLSAFEAAVASGRTRIRPILMTSIATVLGLMPMAFDLGTGGEANVPLARAVIGGLLVSTFLTLFIVPALYVTAKEFFPPAPKGGHEEEVSGLVAS